MLLELADWILAALSFLLGTAIPILYRRLSYEGVSLHQPIDVRLVFQDDSSLQRNELAFSTLVKVVNANSTSLIIDDIHTSRVVGDERLFLFVGVDVRAGAPEEEYHLPPHTKPNAMLDYLPLLVKGNTERVITLGLWYRYEDVWPAKIQAVEEFTEQASGAGVKVRFRINGKYRTYKLEVKPHRRWQETGN